MRVFFDWLIDEVTSRQVRPGFDKIVITTDDLPTATKRSQVQKPLKAILADKHKTNGLRSELNHFPSESDFNLQIADYLCWAFMRNETGKGSWPYSLVSHAFKEKGYLR